MKIQKGRYQHYKGQAYEVIDTVMHSETEEVLVLYRPLYNTKMQEEQGIELWVRPYDMFFENVETEQGSVPRFKYMNA